MAVVNGKRLEWSRVGGQPVDDRLDHGAVHRKTFDRVEIRRSLLTPVQVPAAARQEAWTADIAEPGGWTGSDEDAVESLTGKACVVLMVAKAEKTIALANQVVEVAVRASGRRE